MKHGKFSKSIAQGLSAKVSKEVVGNALGINQRMFYALEREGYLSGPYTIAAVIKMLEEGGKETIYRNAGKVPKICRVKPTTVVEVEEQ